MLGERKLGAMENLDSIIIIIALPGSAAPIVPPPPRTQSLPLLGEIGKEGGGQCGKVGSFQNGW